MVDIPPSTDGSENEISNDGENGQTSNNIISDSSNIISSENQTTIGPPENTNIIDSLKGAVSTHNILIY